LHDVTRQICRYVYDPMTPAPCGEPYAVTCSTVPYLVDGTSQVGASGRDETFRGICKDVLETIGRTPMVRLNRVVPARSAEIVCKLEFFAPGGSIKDRAALAMIEDAEKRGRIVPGATIVEASGGNTGVGLAMVCAVRGYRCVIVVPETTSTDKLSVLRAFGAEVVTARADVEADDPEGYIGTAERLARERSGFMPDQFENPENPGVHVRTTALEILAQCNDSVDAFVACVGSGGTLGGVSRVLRERIPNVTIVGAAPDRARTAGMHGSVVEGVVDLDVGATVHGVTPDRVELVSDGDAVAMMLALAKEEGILAGTSSGVAVSAAIRVAEELGPGKRVVTIIPDTGRNYLSSCLDPAWRSARGLT
jgi:cysteine synthase